MTRPRPGYHQDDRRRYGRWSARGPVRSCTTRRDQATPHGPDDTSRCERGHREARRAREPAGSGARRDRLRRARRRLRSLPGQGNHGRSGARRGRHVLARPRGDRRGAPAAGTRSLPLGGDRARGRGQRPVVGDVLSGPDGPLDVHRRGVVRRVRDLAHRVRAPVARRQRHPARHPRRCGPRARGGRPRRRSRRTVARPVGRHPGGRRPRPGCARTVGSARTPPRRPPRRDPARPTPGRGGRPAEGGVLGVVRALPPLDVARSVAPGHAARLRGARPVRGRARLRRPVPPAHPPHRHDQPQGTRTTRPSPRRATRAARGRSVAPRAATSRSTRSSAPSTTSPRCVRRRQRHGIELALDLAFQCSPDHPWVAASTQTGSAHRRDGTIRYAENPPKRYEDILPARLRVRGPRASCGTRASRSCESWIGRGVRIFRVDNPHTKPFAFWEWLHRRRSSETAPRRDLPRRGVHPARR